MARISETEPIVFAVDDDRSVREGLSALKADEAARQLRASATELRRRYESLTAREREVMPLVISGLLNKQIASELVTSEVTVKMHRGQVMHKMQAESVIDLLRMAEAISIAQLHHPKLKYHRANPGRSAIVYADASSR